MHPKNDNRIFYKECVSLKHNGFDVSLIVAGEENQKINNINIIGLKKNKNRIKRIIMTSFFDLISLCKKIDADIYHFHDPEIIFAALYLKLLGKIVIYDIHENNPAAILSKPYIKYKFQKKIISTVFNLVEQFASNFFDAIVTARPDISERFNHKRIITLRNFPILPDFSKLKTIDIKKTKPAVIFVGGMTKLRGINELLDAFDKLDDCELWLLGPISDKSLEKRILNSTKNVRYMGVVEPYEVFSYIKEADIGIITFLEAPNHIQTLATKPFEYMACGKPIIMSNFDYWKNTFEESSLYVDPSNSNDISDKITSLLSNKSLIDIMSTKNKNLSKNKYNWENECEKLIELYGELSK